MKARSYSVGSLVRCRGREWVVLPSEAKDVVLLRPLTGSQETCGIYLPIGLDEIEPATFPLPSPEDAGDFESCKLLWNAARLNLRSGGGPFRCMGHLSVRPRAYQIVPLLMALRLNPVRLLIADDVGIGKTIEAALIARELLDRGEEKRLAVLCPPYLCDQWQRELKEKFHIDAVVVRSGTVSRLERMLPGGDVSVFDHFPHIIVSVDYAKMSRRRDIFLQACPRLVIVDEAHSCSLPRGRKEGSPQHQRFELLRDLAADEARHLILLTATPHSGIEESFRSLIGFLKPDFGAPGGDPEKEHGAAEADTPELARYFIQRKRGDVAEWLGEKSPFPEREMEERTYDLSEPYRKLFKDVYDFARELVISGDELSSYRRRVRYWAALSLLRCITSSPASAVAALGKRIEKEKPSGSPEEAEPLGEDVATPAPIDGGKSEDSPEELDTSCQRSVMDQSPEDEEAGDDTSPGHIIGQVAEGAALRRLREFRKRAGRLAGDDDEKARVAAETVKELLEEGFHPIVYCRFIATSDYVRDELKSRLIADFSDLHVVSVTSTMTEDERRVRVAELAENRCRVLVATDCLSEGINLQDSFDAVVHYDLPWNPNRLEQREGRVDRFGQSRPRVRAVLIHGRDNPIDNAVLNILIRKAWEIRKRLGISVPIPLSSESVMEAVLHALLFTGRIGEQLDLFPGVASVKDFHREWDCSAEQYERTRRRFAHKHIDPGRVEKALVETDAALGDRAAVESFIVSVCNRMGAISRRDGYWEVDLNRLPDPARHRLLESFEYGSLSFDLRPLRGSGRVSRYMKICFDYPPADGVDVVGRNHPLTEALAEYVFERALEGSSDHDDPERFLASRSGVIRTDAVERKTVILLLRIRYEIVTSSGGRGSSNSGGSASGSSSGPSSGSASGSAFSDAASSGEASSSFAEECVVCGYEGEALENGDNDVSAVSWLPEERVLDLLQSAKPTANISSDEKRDVISHELEVVEKLASGLEEVATKRASRLEETHNSVRKEIKSQRAVVKTVLPVDVVGLFVLTR